MDNPAEKEEFFLSYKSTYIIITMTIEITFPVSSAEELWICKPTSANQGKGIFLVNKLQQLDDKLQADQHNCSPSRRPTARIVQRLMQTMSNGDGMLLFPIFYRYISKPLLLEERKFDIRVFLLFVSGEKEQLMAFYHHGYIRLSCLPYDTSSSDLIVHLTNQYVQKKHPSYNDIKEDTVSIRVSVL